MAEQEIYLAPGEGLPGFPSGHGPGWYLVDYEARTIRPAPVGISPSIMDTNITTTAQADALATELLENQGG